MKKENLKIIFMGTSWIAKEVLASLLEEKYNIIAVFTQPDKKTGRKQEIEASPVKEIAQMKKIPIFQPKKIDEEIIEKIKELSPDLIVVFAYGKIIPKEVLEIPKFKCLNIHPSLLPKYRGPSPIQNAILSGEEKTGITIMIMDEKVDHGDILFQTEVPIDNDETSADLFQKISILSSKLVTDKFPLWIQRKIKPKKQDDEKATYCQLIEREDGHVFWNEEAQEIYNKFRAFHPWPGIFSIFENNGVLTRIKLVKINLSKKDSKEKRQIGEIFKLENDSVAVQSAKGAIIIEEVQIEGKNKAKIKDFVNGYPNFIGSLLK